MASIDQTSLSDDGRVAAMAGWALYILSIPSAALLAPIGVIVAYATRADSSSWVRTHQDEQIRIFWIAFWWAVGLILLAIPAGILTIVLIGFPILMGLGLAGFLVMLWFTVKSVLGLLRLLERRPA